MTTRVMIGTELAFIELARHQDIQVLMKPSDAGGQSIKEPVARFLIEGIIRHGPHKLKIAVQLLDAIGYALALLGEWEQGCALIQKAKKLNPYIRAYNHILLCWNWLRRKEYEKAYLETLNFSFTQFRASSNILKDLNGTLADKIFFAKSLESFILFP